jgi:putative transcriptional regulator
MNKIAETLSEMAKDLYEVGAIDKVTLAQFDNRLLSPVPDFRQRKLPRLGKS